MKLILRCVLFSLLILADNLVVAQPLFTNHYYPLVPIRGVFITMVFIITPTPLAIILPSGKQIISLAWQQPKRK